MARFEIFCRACGCLMVQRFGKYGRFYGCTGFPICKNTMTMREAELEEQDG